MAKNINDAISIITYFNNHKEAWKRLEAVSLRNGTEYKGKIRISSIEFPSDNLIEVREVITRYEEWKEHLQKLDADFAKSFSADWVPITNNFIVDMAFIDLSKEELPLLILGCRDDYYIKVACLSLSHFVEDCEEDAKNHDLSLLADSYIALAKDIADTLNQRDDLNILFSALPDLEMDADYVLDDFRSRKEDNSILRLYPRHKSLKRPEDSDFKSCFKRCNTVCKVWVPLEIGGITFLKYRKSIKPRDLFRYVTVPFTEAGIWQAYLLRQTFHLIGMRWHGEYEYRAFMNTYENIADIYTFNDFKAKKSLQEGIGKRWTSDLLPSVVLDKDCAYVTHCWFDEWKGFVQMKWKVVYDMKAKQIREFQLESEKVLIEYRCGIHF